MTEKCTYPGCKSRGKTARYLIQTPDVLENPWLCRTHAQPVTELVGALHVPERKPKRPSRWEPIDPSFL